MGVFIRCKEWIGRFRRRVALWLCNGIHRCGEVTSMWKRHFSFQYRQSHISLSTIHAKPPTLSFKCIWMSWTGCFSWRPTYKWYISLAKPSSPSLTWEWLLVTLSLEWMESTPGKSGAGSFLHFPSVFLKGVEWNPLKLKKSHPHLIFWIYRSKKVIVWIYRSKKVINPPKLP